MHVIGAKMAIFTLCPQKKHQKNLAIFPQEKCKRPQENPKRTYKEFQEPLKTAISSSFFRNVQ